MTTRPPDPSLAGAVLLDPSPGSPSIEIPEGLAPRDENDTLRHQHTATLVYQAMQLFGQGRFVQAASSLFVAIESNYREVEGHVIQALNRAEALADMLEEASKTIPELHAAIKKRTEQAILESFTPERYQAAVEELSALAAAAGTCDGNHAEPPCADHRCWCKDPADAEDAQTLLEYLQDVVATIERELDDETLSIYQDPETIASLRQADAELAGGETVTHEEALAGETAPVPEYELGCAERPPVDVDAIEEALAGRTSTVSTDEVEELLKDLAPPADGQGDVPPISAQDLDRKDGQ